MGFNSGLKRLNGGINPLRMTRRENRSEDERSVE
jgi:hypothetical protein